MKKFHKNQYYEFFSYILLVIIFFIKFFFASTVQSASNWDNMLHLNDLSLFERDESLSPKFKSNLDRELNTRAHWLLNAHRDFYTLGLSKDGKKFFGWADFYENGSDGKAYMLDKTYKKIEKNQCDFNTLIHTIEKADPKVFNNKIKAEGEFTLDCPNKDKIYGSWYQYEEKGIFISNDKSMYGIFVDNNFYKQNNFDLLGMYLLPDGTYNDITANDYFNSIELSQSFSKSYNLTNEYYVDDFLNRISLASWYYFKKLNSMNENKNNNNLDIYENILNKQYVNANKLNVRNEENGKIIGSVFLNDKLAILSNTGSWSKVITKNGLKGWVSNEYLSEEQILVVNDKLSLFGNQNNYKYCWDFYKHKDKYNFNYITSRKGDCLVSEKEIEPYWCNDKSITDPKLLDGCKNNNSTTKIVKKNDESIKKLEIVVESNQIQDEIAPQIACNEIGIIKAGLANIKCKISDDNELFAVVVNGKQIEGNLENLNEQIQVPFGNSKIEVVAYDSFGNQENLILNVNREFSLVKSQEEIEQLFPGKIKDKSFKNKVAVIIGIQNYADIPDTKYSDKDAMAFAEFANQTLNISSKNIKYLFNEDAKYFGFKGIQTWLENKVNKNTDVYVFYSGHGLGVEGKSKLLPSDFVTQFHEESSYEKDEFLSDIANLKPNHIYAFFDTCFSGLGRNGETLVAGLKNISIVEEVAPVDNITIFNSSSGLEYSTDFDEAEHGLFSYYLMKGLEGNADLNSDNEITSKELFSFISDNVSDRALDIGLSQNPSLIGESNNVIVRW